MAKTAWMVGLALGVLLTPCPSAHAATPRTLVAKVQRVSDGDTITVITAERTKLHRRLLGGAAPEIPDGKKPGQPFGEAARDYLARRMGGRTIRVEPYGPDGFKRIRAVAFIGDVNVNVERVQQGLAELDRGAPCQADGRDLQGAELRAERDQGGPGAQGTAHESPRGLRQRFKTRGAEPGQGDEGPAVGALGGEPGARPGSTPGDPQAADPTGTNAHRGRERGMIETADRRRVARLTIPWQPLIKLSLEPRWVRLLELSSEGARIEHAEPMHEGVVCFVDLPPALGQAPFAGRIVWTRLQRREQTFEGDKQVYYQSGLAFVGLTPEHETALQAALAILKTGNSPAGA